jgi:hypothetical protein
LVGANRCSHIAGELRAFQSGSKWIVAGDVSGAGTADFVLAVNSSVPLAVGDLIF